MNTQELREKAEAAREAWERNERGGPISLGEADTLGIFEDAANPDTIIAILDVVDAAMRLRNAHALCCGEVPDIALSQADAALAKIRGEP